MPTATELNINTTVDATDLANEIFGDGVSVTSATISGDAVQYGIYTGGETTSSGAVPSDGGVILSTGNVADFTNSDGTNNTNTAPGTSTDTVGGVDGDAQLDAIAGVSTFDGVIFEADFVPTGDFITMQFVFSSEEYLEYVNGGVNDAVGVWVNGAFVPLTPTGDTVSIDTVNNASNENLYVDNPEATDPYNTEMDSFTITRSMKAPVNSGQTNTIKIGLADGGDAAYDSNLLIAGDSIQTFALAMSDEVTLLPNDSRVVDVLGNDVDQTGGGLTITEINGQAVSVGDRVILATGETVTLNADGTLTVQSDGDITPSSLTYTVLDSAGNTDVGYLTINTANTVAPDGTVEGSAGDEVIDAAYTGDPNGDFVDTNDAILPGDVGNDDLIQGFGGDDSISADDGDDEVYGGSGNDTVRAGDNDDLAYGGDGADSLLGEAGNDALYGGAGNDYVDGDGGSDTLFGDAGNDSIFGASGTDDLYGGDGNDSLYGGTNDDTLSGGTGNDVIEAGAGSDTVYGGADEDTILRNDTSGSDTIEGGETGSDVDVIDAGAVTSDATVVYTGDEAGSITDGSGTADFVEIEQIQLGTGNDSVDGSASTGGIDIATGAGDDSVTGGSGNDTIDAGAGADTVEGGAGDDAVSLGAGDGQTDTVVLADGFGDDTVQGFEAPTDNGDGTFTGNDLFDVTGLTDDLGNPVHTGDVTVTDDGSGNAVLSFPNGESVTLIGVSPAYADDPLVLGAMGIPMPDGTVSGTAGDDLIDPGYLGDPDGDVVDGNDAFLPGDTGNDDVIDAGAGEDQVYAGDGNDEIYGGADSDLIIGGAGDDTQFGGSGDDIFDLTGGGNNTVTGGETGETEGDVLSVGAYTGDSTVDLTAGGTGADPESGTITTDDGTTTFSEIEIISTGIGDDSVIGSSGDDQVATAEGSDTIDAGAGNDEIDLGGSFISVGNDVIYEGDGDADRIILQDGDGEDEINGFDAPSITATGPIPASTRSMSRA